MNDSLYYALLAALSGVSFGQIAITLRLGQSRDVRGEPIFAIATLAGTIFFAAQGGLATVTELPLAALAWAVAAGLPQYAMLRILRAGLKLGPLSPLWCAVSLGFVPAVVAAHFAYGEHLLALQYVGLAAAIVCVASGSLTQRSGPTAAAAEGGRVARVLFYGMLLVVLVLMNGVAFCGTKFVAKQLTPSGESWLDRYGHAYYMVFYFVIFLGCATDMAITQRGQTPWRRALPLGCWCGAGSIGGVALWKACAVHMSAAALFTASSVVQILTASLASVIFFAERRTFWWYVLVATGIAAVVLFNIQGFLGVGRP